MFKNIRNQLPEPKIRYQTDIFFELLIRVQFEGFESLGAPKPETFISKNSKFFKFSFFKDFVSQISPNLKKTNILTSLYYVAWMSKSFRRLCCIRTMGWAWI